MATSNAEVSSQALRGLHDNLNSLSQKIGEICDTMNSDQMRVGEAWRDSKFQEFKKGFQRQIDNCLEISEHYNKWCVQVLDPAIAKVELIENADVVGDGGSISGGSAASTSVGGTSSSGGSTIAKHFNI